MARIDTSTIEGYAEMTPEQKISALEGFEYDDNAAEVQRLKKANDKSSAEAAEWKRKHNALLSEDEQKKAAEAERIKALEDENATLKRDKTLASHKAKFIGLGYDEALATETAQAMIDGDTEKVFANQQKFLTAHDKAIQQGTMSGTPRPGAGGAGSGPVDFIKMAQEAQASGNPSAAAYYTRLAQTTQTNNE